MSKSTERSRPLWRRRIPPRALRGVLWSLLAVVVLSCGAGIVVLRHLSRDLPSPARLQTIKPPVKTLVFAADGDTLHEYFRQNRVPIRLQDVPPGLIDAIIATEDRNFRDHYGLQFRGMLRSVLVNLKTRSRSQGASTITQQLARSLFLHNRKEWTRKLREMILALQIERAYSKDEILEMYVNTIYFGPAYGFEAASVAFFGKSVRTLTAPEYTLLAGVLNNPGLYSPIRHPERAYERRAVVLRSMVAAGYLTPAAAEEIGQTKVFIRSQEADRQLAPYFVETIRQYLEANYGVKQLYEDGLRVYTCIDAGIQRAAEDALADHLAFLEAEEKYPQTKADFDTLYVDVDEPPVPEYLQGAVVVMDARSGEVRAMVGGRDFRVTKFNRALQAQRQSGSIFKAFLYTAALQQTWTPASILLDAPVEIDAGSHELYRPVNFSGTFEGEITLRYALANSINVPAVRLILDVGTAPVIRVAHAMGVESPIPDVYSIALGSGEANLMEMCSAYTVFANHGIRTRPMLFTKITNSRGEILEENRPYQEEVLDEATAYLMVDLMRTALREGTGQSARSYGFTYDGAGKTGTTDRYTDAWFVGYTPDLVGGVWVGFDRKLSMGRRKTGAKMALPVWARTMVAAQQGRPESFFQRPEGIVDGFVCVDSGQRPAPACVRINREIFAAGREPGKVCEIHQPVATDVRSQAGDFELLDSQSSGGDEFGGGR